MAETTTMRRDEDWLWGRDSIAELGSICEEFRVVVILAGGKRLYEGFRVAGNGTLYSVATTDLDELHAVLREACGKGAGE